MDPRYILTIELDREQGRLLGDALWSFTDSETILEAQSRTELRGVFGLPAYYAVRASEAKIKGRISIADLDVARFMLGFLLAQGWLEDPPAILKEPIDELMGLFPTEFGF